MADLCLLLEWGIGSCNLKYDVETHTLKWASTPELTFVAMAQAGIVCSSCPNRISCGYEVRVEGVKVNGSKKRFGVEEIIYVPEHEQVGIQFEP